MRTRELAHRRMYAQRLWGRQFANPTEVVGSLGAVQAQEFPLAKWSVGQRCRGVTRLTMDRVLAAGEILRTHVLRPTWHFVLPADIRWMLALTGPRVIARMAAYDRQLELDTKLYTRSNAVIAKAVTGRHRTRKELGEALARGKIAATGQRLGHMVMRAELDGIICSGAPRGKLHTYASLDERAPDAKAMDRDEGLAELTKCYFTSHGPATVKDFVWWSDLTVAMAKEGLSSLESELESEVLGGRTYWFHPTRRAVPRRTDAFDLVQIYDEIGIAYS